MIKNARQFTSEFASFVDQTDTVKTNADLLRSVLKKEKKDKDASVGGVLISSHAKWLAEQQPAFAKRLKDLHNTLKEADKLIAEMKKDIPESLKDCEAYFKEMTELKELLEKYGYPYNREYLKPAGTLTGTQYKALEEYIKKLRVDKAAVLKEAAG